MFIMGLRTTATLDLQITLRISKLVESMIIEYYRSLKTYIYKKTQSLEDNLW
jgi:hypothetical protein